MSLLIFFLLIQNIYFINCYQFCSDDGVSLLKMIGNHMYVLKSCEDDNNNYYYNFKDDKCVYKSDYYKPGVCGDLYDDPFQAEFQECRNFPHLTDCVKYYKCDYVNFIRKKCELGKYLNFQTMECDAEECQGISDDEFEEFICNSTNVGRKKIANCDTFFYCSSVHKLSQCPLGMSFNLRTNQCDLKISENVHCNERPISKIECNELRAYGLNFDPTLYYICKSKNKNDSSAQKQVEFYQCPLEKAFNETMEDCV